MFCVNCGTVLRPGTRFCINCGTPARIVQPQPAPQPAEPVSQRCEACGAMMRCVSPQYYVCDYCGGTFAPAPQPVQPAQPVRSCQPQTQKNPEDDLLDSIYAAAKRLLK